MHQGDLHRLNAAAELWWWGVTFQLTGRKSYGTADSLEEAKAAFRAEYSGGSKRGSVSV